MINKTDALKRLDTLEAEAKELRTIIDAPDEPLNDVFYPEVGGDYWALKQSICGSGWRAQEFTRSSGDSKQAYFRTVKAASAYGEAFSTMLDLRAQPRGEREEGDRRDYCVTADEEDVYTDFWYGAYSNTVLSGGFNSDEAAGAAIETVGKDSITKAAKTLARVE